MSSNLPISTPEQKAAVAVLCGNPGSRGDRPTKNDGCGCCGMYFEWWTYRREYPVCNESTDGRHSWQGGVKA